MVWASLGHGGRIPREREGQAGDVEVIHHHFSHVLMSNTEIGSPKAEERGADSLLPPDGPEFKNQCQKNVRDGTCK